MSEQYTTDGHGLMRDGKRYAVCDTPAAAEDLARMGNNYGPLIGVLTEACNDIENLLDAISALSGKPMDGHRKSVDLYRQAVQVAKGAA